MELLRSFLRRHFAGKPVKASRNVDCFLGLAVLQSITECFGDQDNDMETAMMELSGRLG